MTTNDLRKLIGALSKGSPADAWATLDNSQAVPPVTNRDHEIAESRIDSGTFGEYGADYTSLREEEGQAQEDYEAQCASEFRDDPSDSEEAE